MNALSVRGLTKTYKNGVQALQRRRSGRRARRFLRAARTQRRRQDHADRHHHLAGQQDGGRGARVRSRHRPRARGGQVLHRRRAAGTQLQHVRDAATPSWSTRRASTASRARWRAARAEQYLKQLQLWDKRNGISRGLSGGMKRRLMIARALMHEPRLLILDEPTAGVDIEIRRSMWDFLREINARGTTIILTTHYLEEAETLCRNIAIIDGGRIVERDRMSSLLRRLHAADLRAQPARDAGRGAVAGGLRGRAGRRSHARGRGVQGAEPQ